MTSGTGGRDRGGKMPVEFNLSTAFKSINNMVRIGIVHEIDADAGKARCRIEGPTDSKGNQEEILTDWLRWVVPCAASNREWFTPNLDEQVVIFSPCGNMLLAFISGSLNREKYPHESNNVDIRKQVFTHDEDDGANTLDAVIEFNRRSGLHRWWIKEKGAFRFEIADKSCFIMDKEQIQLRVGTTQISVRDGKIALQVKGRTSELLIDELGLLAQTQDKSVWKLLASEISSCVGGKGLVKILAGLVEASVNKNGVVSVRADSISAKLEAQQVRVGLFATQIKAMVHSTWLRLTSALAELRVPGSAIIVTPGSILRQSAAPNETGGAAAGGAYDPGAVAESFTKPANSVPLETPKPPDWSKGVAPYRPVTKDPEPGK